MGTTVRRTRERQARIDEISVLLHGAEGSRVAALAQRSKGKHLEAEELISEAVIAMIIAIDRGVEIIEPLGYAFGVMRNVLLRTVGGREQPVDPSTYQFEDDPMFRPDGGPGSRDRIDQAEVDRRFDEIRSDIETSAVPVAVRAAALARLTLGDAEGIDVADLPAPVAGAAAHEASWWPCAFLATRDTRLFPPDGRAGQAARKARSRFIRTARDLLSRLQER